MSDRRARPDLQPALPRRLSPTVTVAAAMPQPLTSGAGRLRPYRDVRAAFEPWRRAAMVAWSLRDGRSTRDREGSLAN